MASEFEGAVWKKSSHSGGSEGQCVEVADLTATPHTGIVLRDSKHPAGPALLVGAEAFAGFIASLREDQIDA